MRAGTSAMHRYSLLWPLAVLLGGGRLVRSQTASAGDSSPDRAGPTTTVTAVSTTVSVSTATSISTTTTTDSTRIVSIFYLDERAFEGIPYTLLHRVCGNVVAADETATTYVITTTRMDVRFASGTTIVDVPTRTSSPVRTAAADGSNSTTSYSVSSYNATGPPSTITQGPTTFAFTGTRWGDANRTIINQCRLNGTSNARCNLTHVGPIWYTNDPSWNGTFSTFSYNWTSGDRYGFAPCTVTQGVEMMGPVLITETTSTNAAPPRVGGRHGVVGVRADEVRDMVCSAALLVAFVFGLFVLV